MFRLVLITLSCSLLFTTAQARTALNSEAITAMNGSVVSRTETQHQNSAEIQRHRHRHHHKRRRK